MDNLSLYQDHEIEPITEKNPETKPQLDMTPVTLTSCTKSVWTKYYPNQKNWKE